MPDRVTKFLQSLNPKQRKRLQKALLNLQKEPFQGQHIKKLQGKWKGCFRLRVGDIRIIYKAQGKEVYIMDIDYRGNIY